MTDYFKLAQPSDGGRDPLSREDMAAIDDVLSAAEAWNNGELPFPHAAAIGSLIDWQGDESPAYSRYVAITRTTKDDPRRASLVRLLDVLIQAQGFKVTRQGIFQSWEIRENDAGFAGADLTREAA